MSDKRAFTIIIPAHNEEAVIARCLAAIRTDAPGDVLNGDSMQIIVAANGCDDRTVEIARSAAPEAVVLDLPVASKTAAINAANRIASYTPRIYLDADVECRYSALAALAHALRQDGVMTAAPAIRLDLRGCSWMVRAYYRAWLRQPFATSGKGGAGCYGLSEKGLSRLGEFPAVVGDDIWVHTRFADTERRYVTTDAAGQEVASTVYPPRTAWQQIKVEARRRIGTREVQRNCPSPYVLNSNHGGGIAAARRSGANLIDLMVFAVMKLCARGLAGWRQMRGRGADWTRDLSRRNA